MPEILVIVPGAQNELTAPANLPRGVSFTAAVKKCYAVGYGEFAGFLVEFGVDVLKAFLAQFICDSVSQMLGKSPGSESTQVIYINGKHCRFDPERVLTEIYETVYTASQAERSNDHKQQRVGSFSNRACHALSPELVDRVMENAESPANDDRGAEIVKAFLAAWQEATRGEAKTRS